MKEFLFVFKKDKILAIIILFWAIIFTAIPLGFYQIMPVNWKGILSMFFISYVVFYNFGISFYLDKLRSKVWRITLFFTFAPVLSFLTVVTPFVLSGDTIEKNLLFVIILFIIGMLLPYLYFASFFILKKYRRVVIKDLNIVKVSLSIMIALVTIQYAITPIFIANEVLKKTIHFITLIPFSFNVLIICAIEYYNLNKI